FSFGNNYPVHHLLEHDHFVFEEEPVVQSRRQKFVDEYCRKSTIHGIKYLLNRYQNRYEALFWLVWLAISFLCFLFLLSNIWIRYNDEPMVAMEISPNQKPIWDIPFPAITICTETKAKSNAIKFSEVYRKLVPGKRPFTKVTPTELETMQALSQVCDSHLTSGFEFNQNTASEDIFRKLKEVLHELMDLLELVNNYTLQVAPSTQEVLYFCKKRNQPHVCDSFFSEVWTEDGLCFTYNILNSSHIYTSLVSTEIPPIQHNKSDDHWNIETGYNEKATNDILSFPYRAHSGGNRGALVVLVNLNSSDYDHMCRGPIVGFKVTMHRPDEVPFVSKEWFRVPMHQESYVTITPRVILTDDSLKRYDAESRQCFFGNERQLKYFKTYTQRNCEMECVSDYIIKKCNCARFSMPRTSETPICGASMIQCYHRAEDELLSQNIRNHISLSKSENSSGCNCLPACTSIKYDTEVSHSDFDFKSIFEAYETPLDNFKETDMARITFAFKDTYFNPTLRRKVSSFTEVVALCGGLLALFFGASLMSIWYCPPMPLKKKINLHAYYRPPEDSNLNSFFDHLAGALVGDCFGMIDEDLNIDMLATGPYSSLSSQN
ncbi:Pickpocket protein 28, partial [Pseudolycoriella hygida]